MNKLIEIEKDLLTARKSRQEKDVIAISVLGTLKGEYQSAVKKDGVPGDELVESIVKKMIKNANVIGNDEAMAEIKILEAYMPQMLSEAEIKPLVENAIVDYPEKLEEYKAGNKGLIGFFMGAVIKVSNGKADPKSVNKVILEVLNS